MDDDLKSEFEELRREYSDDSTFRFINRSATRALMWDKSGGKCWYCGKEMNPFRDFSVDHLVPLSDGGDDSYENLVPVCRYCNHAKGSRSLEVFRTTLAKRMNNYPGFTPEQMEWLEKQGVEIPMLSIKEFKFHFEEMRST